MLSWKRFGIFSGAEHPQGRLPPKKALNQVPWKSRNQQMFLRSVSRGIYSAQSRYWHKAHDQRSSVPLRAGAQAALRDFLLLHVFMGKNFINPFRSLRYYKMRGKRTSSPEDKKKSGNNDVREHKHYIPLSVPRASLPWQRRAGTGMATPDNLEGEQGSYCHPSNFALQPGDPHTVLSDPTRSFSHCDFFSPPVLCSVEFYFSPVKEI